MAQEQVKHKRRQYYINKKFQSGFILKFILLLVIGGGLSVDLTVLTSKGTLTSTYEGSRLVIQETSLAILPSVVWTNIITTLLIGVVAIIVMIFVSHKIAGPMYRFESDLKIIAEGDLKKRIHLRQGDQFAEMAGNLNEMVASLNVKISEIHDELGQLQEKASAQGLPQEFVEELADCRQKIESRFKL